MKISVKKRLEKELLGERLLNEYSYLEDTGESDDGMRRGFSYKVYVKEYGNIKDEVKNADGSYTYEYLAKKSYDGEDRTLEPGKREYDLEEVVRQLMFKYGINEFFTEFQNEVNSIKDYYALIEAKSQYQKDSEANLSYSWSVKKKDKYYDDPNRGIIWSLRKKFKAESIREANDDLDSLFLTDDYIDYLIGKDVEKNCEICLGLDDIGDDQSVRDFLGEMSLTNPKYKTFEDAIKNGEITIDNIKEYAKSSKKKVDGSNIPHDILEKLFKENENISELFVADSLPMDLLRKYNQNFNIMSIDVSKLKPEDLDSVLDGFRRYDFVYSDKKKEYIDYLKQFCNDPEKLKKIFAAMNSSREDQNKIHEPFFYTYIVKDFIDEIPEGVISEGELRDSLLDDKRVLLDTILEYKFEYDDENATKLLEHLKNSPVALSVSDICSAVKIGREHGISDEEIADSLAHMGFNMKRIDSSDLEELKGLKIKGITLDQVKEKAIEDEKLGLLALVVKPDEAEMTSMYKDLLDSIAKKHVYRKQTQEEKDKDIYELILDYSNSSALLSEISPEEKEIAKRKIIDNLDTTEEFRYGYLSENDKFAKVMETMVKSFNITENDFVRLYTKCLNNGYSKDTIMDVLNRYITEEKREEFIQKIERSNIYPNPKYFWLTSNSIERIQIDRGMDRTNIKSKIQADGRCFSTKITTDMVGEGKDGKKIPVNNLSKWLFGVPGARGNLTITKSGNYIQLPGNTPKEAVRIIEESIKEKSKDVHSK